MESSGFGAQGLSGVLINPLKRVLWRSSPWRPSHRFRTAPRCGIRWRPRPTPVCSGRRTQRTTPARAHTSHPAGAVTSEPSGSSAASLPGPWNTAMRPSGYRCTRTRALYEVAVVGRAGLQSRRPSKPTQLSRSIVRSWCSHPISGRAGPTKGTKAAPGSAGGHGERMPHRTPPGRARPDTASPAASCRCLARPAPWAIGPGGRRASARTVRRASGESAGIISTPSRPPHRASELCVPLPLDLAVSLGREPGVRTALSVRTRWRLSTRDALGHGPQAQCGALLLDETHRIVLESRIIHGDEEIPAPSGDPLMGPAFHLLLRRT